MKNYKKISVTSKQHKKGRISSAGTKRAQWLIQLTYLSRLCES